MPIFSRRQQILREPVCLMSFALSSISLGTIFQTINNYDCINWYSKNLFAIGAIGYVLIHAI